MMEEGRYKTIAKPSEGLFRDKGSRFLAFAYPVSSVEDIKPILEKLRKEYHDARHHCYAYMLGQDRLTWRINDDGEPSGTAGKPILGQINSAGLTNILIVVIRYFGGTLLGVSGLINAYRAAAAFAISAAEIAERELHDHYEIVFPYAVVNDTMKILKDEEVIQSGQKFELECSMTISFSTASRDRILARLSRVEGLSLKYCGTS